MGRVQIGKKQRVEVSEYDESTKAIARKIVRDIVAEGFNGADVLPGIWVLEKTLRNHIVAEQPNISPDISVDEIEDLAQSMLSSIKTKTDTADEKVRSLEDYENALNVPKELPTIKMGNISVVKFPEGGSDAARSIKVEGFKKVGKFYRPKLDNINEDRLDKKVKANKEKRKRLEYEKKQSLRRIKLRRGLLKPLTTLTPLGRPIGVLKKGTLPKPFAESKAAANIKLLPSVQKAIDKAVSPVKRELPFFAELKPEQQRFLKENARMIKAEKEFALDRDTKFLQKAKKMFPKQSSVFGEGSGFAGFRSFRG
jgi:hypothetical protein